MGVLLGLDECLLFFLQGGGLKKNAKAFMTPMQVFKWAQ
ncbi:hypothetical protein C4K01_3485 [Pseudomonas synxantha]|nr:hypothetical protein C4K01_3485 [Pseudomonas synxantha]